MKSLLKIKSIALAAALAVTVSVSLSACGGANSDAQAPSPAANAAKPSEVKIAVVGSTSVQPLAQELADEYTHKMPNVKIDIQGVGSSAGIKAAIDGTSDIGTASRELTKEEAATGLTEHIIAMDGIGIVVNPKNAVSNLTKDQIAKIFKGEIKNWKEVGGADKEILIVSREAGSGTRGAFEELLKLQKKEGDKTISLMDPKAMISEGNGAVKASIAGKDNAIGYLSLRIVDSSVKAVKIDGVDATEANVKAKTYPISRPFLMLTKGEVKPEVKAFLEYIMGDEGQKIAAKDFISIK